MEWSLGDAMTGFRRFYTCSLLHKKKKIKPPITSHYWHSLFSGPAGGAVAAGSFSHPTIQIFHHYFRVDGSVYPVCCWWGTTEADKMLSRWSRLGPTLPRILANSGVRFVSQSQKSAAVGSATLSELQPPHAKDSHDHGEVNHYVKVSSPTQTTVWIRWS